MIKCACCFRRKNLMHFEVNRKTENGFEIINPNLYLCKKCCNKIFGKGWDKWEETLAVNTVKKK